MRSGIFLAIVVGATNAASADTIHVPGDYPTIQAAILAALEGDEIIVASGTYNEAIFFNGHNITLRSDAGPEVTTIDATGLNNSVVRVTLGEGPSTVIDGFTITGGVSGGNGGGIYCLASSPWIKNCIIRNNTADIFGGGLYAFQSVGLSVTHCRFIENHASYRGGGVSTSQTHQQFRFCLFQANTATSAGGGLNLQGVQSASLVNCLISDNSVNLNTGFAGGALLAGNAITIINCTISRNIASCCGGGLTIAGSATITNCVAWANTPDSLDGDNADIDISYSNIEFGYPGCDFCILADPLFVDPVNGDFRLAPGSPCIDLGNNAAVPKGIDTDLDGAPRFMDDPDTNDCPQPGADCGSAPIVDMGAYEFQPALCPWDLDGSGTVGASDLLSLLVSWGPCKGCPADFDGNGTVGASDLLALLVNWGPCP